MKPRPYQNGAFDSILGSFRAGAASPLCVLPTGTGKSIVIKMLVEYALSFPGQRVLVASHTKEIVEQDYAKIGPGFDAGIYSAGLGRRDTGNAAIFCGIQSAYRRADLFGRVNLLVIDECHLVSDKGASMYQKFITALRAKNPGLCIVGFTATPFRLDSGKLIEGELFDRVAYDGSKQILRYIHEGYLAPLVTLHTEAELDTQGVKILGGDFKLSDLQLAVNQADVTKAAVKEIIRHGADRKHWLVFASGIEHAEAVRDAFEAEGIPAGVVHSKRDDRDEQIAAFREGRIRALVNNNVLTVGFDFPAVDLIGVLRPTVSPVLWVQLCGRGMRPAPGKRDCLVLDFARNIERLGPINAVEVPKRKRGEAVRSAPVKYCPVCGRYCHASARQCECGHQWTREIKIATEAATGAILDDGKPKAVWFDVTGVKLDAHEKPGKVPTVRVTYRCGLRVFRRWLCPEHSGYARRVFDRWWAERAEGAAPGTVAGVLAAELREPARILVNVRGKYPEILNDSPHAQNLRD